MAQAQAHYSSIGATISVRVQLKDLSAQDRRNLLSDLLRDEETCPGQLTMTPAQRRESMEYLDRYTDWMGKHAKKGDGA